MFFQRIANGGCQSYLIGCEASRLAALIDPELSHLDHYIALAARDGLRIRWLIDTHTHADHFSATHELARRLGAPVVMHTASPAPFVDLRLADGELLRMGDLRLRALHTPGHTADSMCLQVDDRLFTGDTLLIGGTGRTDLPSGDPEALYDSLFNRVLKLDPTIKVHPAHDYHGRESSTIGEELSSNPRLQVRERSAFVAMMNGLNLTLPAHMTAALRTNTSGGRTVAQMLADAAAAVAFMAPAELEARIGVAAADLIVLDVRERDAYESGHIRGAMSLPRGELELRADLELPDPARRIVTCCELGQISTLAAATLRELGFRHAVALDGGIAAWRDAGYPLATGAAP